MNRLAAIVVVLLIGGTAAAFAYTQGLKQTKSPIVATHVFPKQFSPTCGCPTRTANIAFGLRSSDHVTISILDSHRRVVRTLLDDRAVRHGYHRFTWNGHFANGRLAPDGVYKPRVDLADADRTINLPNTIRLDTVPPRIVGAASHTTSSLLRVRYRFSEQAHALLYVAGTRRVKSRSYKPLGTIQLPLGSLRRGQQVALGAVDLAGNVSKLRVLKVSLPRGKRR